MPEDMDSKPAVAIPAGDPPADLQIEDLEIGEGDEAKAGNDVLVHYVGVAWSDGKQFDSSWDRGQPAEFPVGVGQLIKGWDEGLVGVPVGSRVQLDIPAELAYGENATGGRPAGDLRFVVDVLAAQ